MWHATRSGRLVAVGARKLVFGLEELGDVSEVAAKIKVSHFGDLRSMGRRRERHARATVGSLPPYWRVVGLTWLW